MKSKKMDKIVKKKRLNSCKKGNFLDVSCMQHISE